MLTCEDIAAIHREQKNIANYFQPSAIVEFDSVLRWDRTKIILKTFRLVVDCTSMKRVNNCILLDNMYIDVLTI